MFFSFRCMFFLCMNDLRPQALYLRQVSAQSTEDAKSTPISKVLFTSLKYYNFLFIYFLLYIFVSSFIKSSHSTCIMRQIILSVMLNCAAAALELSAMMLPTDHTQHSAQTLGLLPSAAPQLPFSKNTPVLS